MDKDRTNNRKDVPAEDTISQSRTIYDVTFREIVVRNFVAGASRTVGSVIVYSLLLFMFGTVFLQVVWPRISPIIEPLLELPQMIPEIPDFQSPRDYF